MKKIASVLMACAFSTVAFAQATTPAPAAAPTSVDRTRPSPGDEAKVAGQTVDTVPMAKSSPDNATRVKKTSTKKNAKKAAVVKPAS